MIDLTRYNLTAEMELTLLEIEFESGPDSTEPDHICRAVPWPKVARALFNKGLADYSRFAGYRLTHNGRAVVAALRARSGRRSR